MLASESDRSRFYREARAAAALQHPNIATVFEIDETEDGQPFIAMEFIEGDSLDELIARGPLPLDKAIQIGIQIADALKTAHAKHIVHRDVKSANVMLATDGRAKVLDFGLAKTAASTKLTQMDSTLGTVAYMSPEQTTGREVDLRTDLWSLGVVLFEMIAGRLPFLGDYDQAIVYNILNETPQPLTAVRTGVPMQLEAVVHKALMKDVELRYQTASDLIADLKAVLASGQTSAKRSEPVAPDGRAQAPVPDSKTARMPAGAWGLVLAARALAISGSGAYIAYTDGDYVFVRDMGSGDSWAIPESEDIYRMVFTPDENWLVLERPGTILQSRIRDGTPFEVTSVAAAFARVSIAPDNALVYEGGGRIWRLDPATGVPEPAIEMDAQIFYNEPQLTENGQLLVVQLERSSGQSTLGVFDYPGGGLRGELPMMPPDFQHVGDYMVILRDGQLHGVAIDLQEPRLLGAAVPLGIWTSRGAWWVSDEGHLFYAPVSVEGGTTGFSNRFLQSVSFDGVLSELPPSQTFYEDVSVDAEGRRAAVVITEGPRDIWVVDLFTGIRKPVTTGSSGSDPSWHPSADSILYVRTGQSEDVQLAVRAVDVSGDDRVLYSQRGTSLHDPEWSPDRQFVLFGVESNTTDGHDIWRLNLNSGQAEPVVGGNGDQQNGTYSPDGRLVAFQGPDAAGRTAVWVQTASFTGPPKIVSDGPGSDPRWGPDGSSLYFIADDRVRRVPIDAEGSAARGTPVDAIASVSGLNPMWDVLPDGSGIVLVTDVRVDESRVTWADSSRMQVNVVLNWVKELAELVPYPN
jgi:Tol biopolymer transport system component